MREFAKISPQFWVGKTAKELRGHQEAQIVAMYLMSSPHANMIGLYYLPKMFISHETGLTLQGACKGLARCIDAGFCRYDEEAEMVWVVEMAMYQIGELKPSDKRCVGAQNEYMKVAKCQHLQCFYDKYVNILNLSSCRDDASPIEAPSKQGEEEREGKEEGEGEGKNKPRCAQSKFFDGESVTQQVVEDFLAIRKAKRSPLTQTALDGIKREAENAGITLENALRVCIERGWQGFKADWYQGQGKPNQPTGRRMPAPDDFENKEYVGGAL
jgi:hypothetical protein